MISIAELIYQLNSLNIKIQVEGNNLRVNAPKGVLTPELRVELTARKPEIIDFLRPLVAPTPITPERSGIPIPSTVSRTGDLTPATASVPASFAQQRLWFLTQLQGPGAAYNIPLALHLHGKLNYSALEGSLTEIIRRHAILRTTFSVVQGSPVQIIAPSAYLRLVPVETHDADVLDILHTEIHRPFDLECGPLIRTNLLRIAPEEHILLLTMHHIISDGWSMDVFANELSAIYNALDAGKPSPLPDLPIQYADYATWQHQRLQGETLQRQLDYWRSQLVDIPPILELPWDRPRPPVQNFHGANQRFALTKEITQGLLTLAQQTGSTLFMVLLSAFAILLARYSRQSDIVIGTPVTNRNSQELEPLIGFFVNTLALRINTTYGTSFIQLLEHVRQVALGAYDHAEVPFEKLVEELQPERSLSHTPLFQVMFSMQSAKPSYTLSGLTVEPMQITLETAKFDLTLSITAPDGINSNKSASNLPAVEPDTTTETTPITAQLEYNTDLFEASTIQGMVSRFQTLLSSILANPHLPITQLGLLDEAEQNQILYTWNQTTAPYPVDSCIHEIFERQAVKTPNATAVIFGDPVTPSNLATVHPANQITYHDLNARANQLAHYLCSIGVGPEKLVGLCTERSVEMIVGLLAILKAGGAYLPLDPTYPAERLAFILRDASPCAVLVQEHLLASIPTLEANVPQLIFLDRDWPIILAHPDAYPPTSGVTPQNLAYAIYTSGSTGKPKGAMIEHRSVVNLWRALLHAIYNHLAPSHHVAKDNALESPIRVSMNASLLFDASVKQWVTLLSGYTLDIIPEEVRLDGESLLDYIRGHQLDVLDCVPSQLKLLLDNGLLEEQHWMPRAILAGGEAIDMPTWKRISRDGSIAFYNMYGPTECTVDASICRISERPLSNPESPEYLPLATPSIGRPVNNAQIYILDDQMQPVPPGVPGELFIGGAGVGRGYLHRPAVTARVFVPDPFSKFPGARLYRSGDLARYLPNGYIQFIARTDNQVKVRGFRIELEDVESALAQHPAIAEVAAIVREDTPGDTRLVAYFATTPASENAIPTQQELHQFLAEKLPSYMIPSIFVRLEALPRTPNRKIDRRALPAPEMNCLDTESMYVAPRDAVEQALTDIWAKVLELQRVGVLDNFFEMGGHSLLVTQLLYRIREMFQIDLPLRSLFDHPTVAEMAQLIRESRPAIPLPPFDPSIDDLLTDAQLDPTINLPIRTTAQTPVTSSTPAILLTGATGFIGAFLLRELLQQTQANIYCLVRASDTVAARQRIIERLEGYSIWRPEFNSRIIPVVGDLAKASLGLSDAQFRALARQIDVIYHAGAWVNFILPYEILKPANVLGTREILRLATHTRPIPVHYLSTLSVFSIPRRPTNSELSVAQPPILESDEPDPSPALQVGYSQSKWVAEKLVAQAGARGLPVSIYRIGTASGSQDTGACNNDDYVCRFIKGCIQIGNYPDLDIAWRLIPVDYLSQVLMHLSMQPDSAGKTFHLLSPHRLHLAQWINWAVKLGYPLQSISYERWQTGLAEIAAHAPDHALYPLVPLLLSHRPLTVDDELKFDTRNVEASLAGTGLTCPPIDEKLLRTYFSYMIRTGFLPDVHSSSASL